MADEPKGMGAIEAETFLEIAGGPLQGAAGEGDGVGAGGQRIGDEIERAGGKERPPAVGIGGIGQVQRADARLDQRAAAGDGRRAEVRALLDRIGAVEDEGPVVGDCRGGGERADGPAAAQLQGAGRDRGGAGVAVAAGKHHPAAAELGQPAAAADRAGVAHRVGTAEDQGGVVDEAAAVGEVDGGRRAADLQRAGGDRGRAGVGVQIGQDDRIRAELDERAAAADRARQGLGSHNRSAPGCR